jgi:hypothetical protein
LRRNEDRSWVSALEAKNKWDCKDAKLLFDPLQKAMTFYKAQAGLEMKRLGNCGERIIVSNDPNTAMERAENAYKTGDFSVARETSWKFVSLSTSIGQRARTLLQTIEQHEKANSLMTLANSAQIAGRSSEACGLMMRVEEEYGSLSGLDLRSVRSKLADCRASRQPSALPAAERRRQFEKNIEAARGYLDQGNLELATDSVQAAESLIPNDKALEELKQATTAAKEFRNALERSIAQIYQSKNLDAMVGLRDLLATNPTSQALAAKAHFYMGVAMAKQYYVFDDLMLLDKAKLEFKISMDGYPSPDFENVQPEIKELYGQAVRGPGAGVL